MNSFKIDINYSTNGAVSLSLGPSVNPYIVLRRTSPSTTDLIKAQKINLLKSKAYKLIN